MAHHLIDTSERQDESISRGLVIDGMLVARIWDPSEEFPLFAAALCDMDGITFYAAPSFEATSFGECMAWALATATLALEA
jgi:hypothetical protein